MDTILRKALSLSLALVSFASIGQAASPGSYCERPKQVRKASAPASQAPSSNPISQEVVVYCSSGAPATRASAPSQKDSQENQIDWIRPLEALFKLLSSLAWPFAAYLIARHFRAELAALLARLKKVKAGSAEAEFERGVNEASQSADIPHVDQEPEDVAPAVSAAIADPRGAILSAWLEVERAVFRLLEVRQLNVPSLRPKLGVLPAMKAIQSANALDPNYVGLFHDLRSLRNAAAHNYEFNPEPEAVLHYTKLARSLAKAIEEAANDQQL